MLLTLSALLKGEAVLTVSKDGHIHIDYIADQWRVAHVWEVNGVLEVIASSLTRPGECESHKFP